MKDELQFPNITSIVINNLTHGTDITDEATSSIDLTANLDKTCKLSFFGVEFTIDSLHYVFPDYLNGHSSYGSLCFYDSQKKADFHQVRVNPILIKQLRDKIRKEEEPGNKLQNWCWSDEIEGLLI